MIDDGVNVQLQNVDDRLARVEQFLPSVATKDDLKAFATKDDLNAQRRELDAVIATLATKDDLNEQRRELEAVIATLATKDELTMTRQALQAQIRDEGERTRTHFDVVAESLRDEIRTALEGHIAIARRVETLESGHDRLDRRVGLLEAGGSKRRK